MLAVSDLGAGFTRGERATGVELGTAKAATGVALGVVPALDDLTTNETRRATDVVGLGRARAGLALHGTTRNKRSRFSVFPGCSPVVVTGASQTNSASSNPGGGAYSLKNTSV